MKCPHNHPLLSNQIPPLSCSVLYSHPFAHASPDRPSRCAKKNNNRFRNADAKKQKHKTVMHHHWWTDPFSHLIPDALSTCIICLYKPILFLSWPVMWLSSYMETWKRKEKETDSREKERGRNHQYRVPIHNLSQTHKMKRNNRKKKTVKKKKSQCHLPLPIPSMLCLSCVLPYAMLCLLNTR